VTLKSEQVASRSLRELLVPLADGEPIPDSDDYQSLKSALHFLLPDLLAREHAFHDELDGSSFGLARKTGPREAELAGHCQLIDDQAWAPIYLRLRVAEDADELEYVDCRLGEPGSGHGGIERIPCDSPRLTKHFYAFVDRVDTVPWVYRIVRSRPALP
jgi:hypothetical protein